MWADPGSSRPPPPHSWVPWTHHPVLATIMVMMIWYWKVQGMSSGGPAARGWERGLERPVPPERELEDAEEPGGRSQDVVPALWLRAEETGT